MTISKIAELLECGLVCGTHNLDKEASSAYGADLMSDVLAFAKENCVLLTGMVNQHVVRTAEMLDIICIVFVRGKTPPVDVCDLAERTGVTLMTSSYSLYESSGILYANGLLPCSKV